MSTAVRGREVLKRVGEKLYARGNKKKRNAHIGKSLSRRPTDDYYTKRIIVVKKVTGYETTDRSLDGQ